MSSKGAKAGASAKAKKPTKSGTEDKREDVLQAVVSLDRGATYLHLLDLTDCS